MTGSGARHKPRATGKRNKGRTARNIITHRIDWVFKRPGMPLRITAEYENWRRVEDADGAGGWMHYSLLSGSRTALVNIPMLDLLSQPQPGAAVVLKAEAGVVARLSACRIDWCRISIEGETGWAAKAALWGVESDEVFE